MKIYSHTSKQLVRLTISQQGSKTEYITLCECTHDEVISWITKLISDNVKADPFLMGKKTCINIRQADGGRNGKSKSISFRGLNPKETFELIQKDLNSPA